MVGPIEFGPLGLIGRQSDTQTGVENHYLRMRVGVLEAAIREALDKLAASGVSGVRLVEAEAILRKALDAPQLGAGS